MAREGLVQTQKRRERLVARKYKKRQELKKRKIFICKFT